MKIRVYYDDTDCGNVVYYANYLKYMERGRTELMREKGIAFARYHNEGLMFVVAEASIKYHAPAVYDDLLDVETSVRAVSPVSITFQTLIANEKGVRLVTGETKVACVNREGKVRRIPAEIVEALKR
jgi:acyl-CoA thioester hydrolase